MEIPFFQNLRLQNDSLCITSVKENYEWAYLDEEFNLTHGGGGG
ncbi:hypothetical protein [Campylobacter vulpis]|nr:hypothetical protein [Campylobacter vulpis]